MWSGLRIRPSRTVCVFQIPLSYYQPYTTFYVNSQSGDSPRSHKYCRFEHKTHKKGNPWSWVLSEYALPQPALDLAKRDISLCVLTGRFFSSLSTPFVNVQPFEDPYPYLVSQFNTHRRKALSLISVETKMQVTKTGKHPKTRDRLQSFVYAWINMLTKMGYMFFFVIWFFPLITRTV